MPRPDSEKYEPSPAGKRDLVQLIEQGKQLLQTLRELKAAGKLFRAFEVLNAGRYERHVYLNVGGNLAPKTIPPEVSDPRAVEKGQVRFRAVALIEVTPRFGGRRRGDESQTSSSEKKSQSLLTSSPTNDGFTLAVEPG